MRLPWALVSAALAAAKCYEPSVAHPPPEFHADDILLEQAFQSIGTALANAVATPEFASTSFSVEITSAQKSIWAHHHTALERNASRPDVPQVNGDALYRIASITKTFTVLGILYQHKAGNLHLDDTVNKYIEELGDVSDGGIPWKDITLRSLASQLSGIPREFAQGDLINTDKWPWDVRDDIGLPPVSEEGLIKCDEYSFNYETPCIAEDLLDAVKSKRPVYAPNQQSTYSNVAFELLGLVIERVTNQSYESYINDAIFKPVNMSKSTLSLPPDSAGVIPLQPHYWDVDEGIQNPTGGIYASSTDMSKYLRYILHHFNGITHAINWVHPVSPSGGIHSFYGMPWEIFQTDRILKDSKRTVRFITKGGGLPGYTSRIMTAPEYNLGITILVAGEPSLLSVVQEIVTIGIIRAAEELSIRQLHAHYSGTYASQTPSLNSSIKITADARGLVITEWISNSTDVLKSKYVNLAAPKHWYAQLVPTLLYRNEKEQKGEEWRIQLTAERSEHPASVWDDFCVMDVENAAYANVQVNEVVFWDANKEGRFDRLELVAFRANLTRVVEESDGSSGNGGGEGLGNGAQEVIEL